MEGGNPFAIQDESYTVCGVADVGSDWGGIVGGIGGAIAGTCMTGSVVVGRRGRGRSGMGRMTTGWRTGMINSGSTSCDGAQRRYADAVLVHDHRRHHPD